MKPDAAIGRLAPEEGLTRARDFLSSALRLDAMIALKLARMDKLREQAGKMRALAVWDERNEEARKCLEDQLLSDYHQLSLRQQRIGEYLARVPDERHRTVLEMRYLQGMPFFRIAMAMHYDERQIYRYHRAGLQHVAVQMALEAKKEKLEAKKEKSD